MYDNGDHTKTIQITVWDPVPSISTLWSNFTIHQWEDIDVLIPNGWWEYEEESYNSDIISFDVDNYGSHTWKIDISRKEPTYPKGM